MARDEVKMLQVVGYGMVPRVPLELRLQGWAIIITP